MDQKQKKENKVRPLNSKTIKKAYTSNLKQFFTVLGICLAPIFVSIFLIIIVSAHTSTETTIVKEFTKGNLPQLFGKIVIYFSIYILNFLLSYKQIKIFRDRVVNNLLLIFMIVAVFIVSAFLTTKNAFAIPLIFLTLTVYVLMTKRLAFINTISLAAILIMHYATTKNLGVILPVLANVGTALLVLNFTSVDVNRGVFLLKSLLISFISVVLIVFASLLTAATGKEIGLNILWGFSLNIGGILLMSPISALLELMLNLTNDFRLRELCNLNNDLLKRLANEAPGTFNHSLAVGTIAEYCAIAIGESGSMARCAAYYHDIGKLKAPLFFTENQTDKNPHDDLIPEVSANIITAHTVFGKMLAEKNRLPKEIANICVEHHGTTPVGYFYNVANNLTEDKELSKDKYRYTGTLPQTKISVIIMIADTIEATFRSFEPKSQNEIKEKIDSLVQAKIDLGQFDESPITLGELNIIKKTIFDIIPSIIHKRISYAVKR